MKTCTVGERVFMDYHFGGKPKGIVVEVVQPGNGKSLAGEIRVRLTETVRAYRKGEIVVGNASNVVPLSCILPLRAGQYHTRISTLYEWVKL